MYALPTAQLASTVRRKHPHVDVDTCAAAFYFYKSDATEHMDVLQQFDLIVIDEVSQLSDSQFERIFLMWVAADRMLALVFTGDFWLLPGLRDRIARDVALQGPDVAREAPAIEDFDVKQAAAERDVQGSQVLDASRAPDPRRSSEDLREATRCRRRYLHASSCKSLQ